MLSDIRDLYSLNQGIDINKFPATVTAHFQQQYSSEHAFNTVRYFILKIWRYSNLNSIQQIPVLDLDSSPESIIDGSLVAFSAMVQDTSLSPELYLAKTSDGYCGGWGLQPAFQSDNVQYCDLKECRVFWAVSIPGLSPWCRSTASSELSSFRAIFSHKYPIPEAPHLGVRLKVTPIRGQFCPF